MAKDDFLGAKGKLNFAVCVLFELRKQLSDLVKLHKCSNICA